jgi:hypothetical protein
MNINTLKKIVMQLPPDISVLMRGPTGIGKSDVARDMAKLLGLPYIDVRGASMSEDQISGFPDITTSTQVGAATYVLPSWYIRACKEPCVINLDEFNRAMSSVMSGFFQIVLDRELGNNVAGEPWKLHPETRVFACINEGSEYDVNDINPALLRRFWTVDVEASNLEWADWADKREEISRVLVEFIRQNPEHFRVEPSTVTPGSVIPSPASWCRLDKSLKHAGIKVDEICGSKPPIMAYQIAMGFVGAEAAIAYTEFVARYNNIITAEDVLKGRVEPRRLEQLSPSESLQLIAKIVNHSNDNNWSDTQTKNFCEFIQMKGGDFIVHSWNLLGETSNTKNILKAHNIIGKKVTKLIKEARAIEQGTKSSAA